MGIVVQSARIMPPLPSKVVVHPLVLLSVVDHYNRVANDSKRVVGCLLGDPSGGVVEVLNSFAIPFEEDDKDPAIWFLDHNYVEKFTAMSKKVNARERIIGWYSTGPKIRPADLAVNEVFKRYVKSPTFLIVDVNPTVDMDIPTNAYATVEVVKDDGTPTEVAFQHLPCEIGALEAEEIGVEHLLRDVKDLNVSTLTQQVSEKVSSLQALQVRLEEVNAYLDRVVAKELPINHEITRLLQEVFNLIPNLNVEELVRSFTVQTNDMMLVVYVSSLIRSVLALHSLVNNKVRLREAESAAAEKSEEKDGKEKGKAAGKGEKIAKDETDSGSTKSNKQ